MSFRLSSLGITEKIIDDRYGKRSNDILEHVPQISLPLHWSGVPANTRSFAITFIDYDNIEDEGLSWIHWLIANIPGDTEHLDENASRTICATEPSIIQGRNSWFNEPDKNRSLCTRYGGPSPTKFPHEYELEIFALDKYLDLNIGFTYNQLRKEMRRSILGRAALYAVYHP